MNHARRQHWNPRLYLRSFATPDTAGKDDPDVWLFHKDEGDPFRTSISNVAVEIFLYSPKLENGQRNFKADSRLQTLESTIAPLWKELAEGRVELDDPVVRKGIGLFLATLFHRNPQRMDDQRVLLSEVIRRYEESADVRKRISSQEYEKLINANNAYDNREELKDSFVAHLLNVSRPMAEQLISKRWAVLVAEEPLFATSDQPFIVLHEDIFLRSIGFFAGSIMIPISPTRVMFLDDSHEEGNGYYALQPETIGAFHGIVLHHAIRFMISSRPSDEVLAELVELADRLDPKTE
jgi:hypothetical protein